MLAFAVCVEGVSKPNQAQWVLAVSRESLLIVHDDGSLHWHKLADCKFARLVSPDVPQPVTIVESQRIVLSGPGALGKLGRGDGH